MWGSGVCYVTQVGHELMTPLDWDYKYVSHLISPPYLYQILLPSNPYKVGFLRYQLIPYTWIQKYFKIKQKQHV